MTIKQFRKLTAPSHKIAAKKSPRRSPGAANKTEAEFNRDFLAGRGLYEAISFKIAGGHRYTPDFIVSTPDGINAYEVKGAFKFPSEGRARLAFDDARERYPAISFFYFRKTRSGWVDET